MMKKKIIYRLKGIIFLCDTFIENSSGKEKK